MELGGRICIAVGDGTPENGRSSEALSFLKGLVDNVVVIIETVVTKDGFSTSKTCFVSSQPFEFVANNHGLVADTLAIQATKQV